MSEKAGRRARALIWRRITVKSVVFAIWAMGMLGIVLYGNHELAQNTYAFMLLVIVIAWAISTVRDVRRLREQNVGERGN